MSANFQNSQFMTPGSQEAGQDDMQNPITMLEDLPNGDTVYQIGEMEEQQQEEAEVDREFFRNILEDVGSAGIVGDLLDEIQNDIDSRQEWENMFNKGMKLLGIKIEESRDYPFMHACAAYDTTLNSALFRFWSTARAELFPATGPARFQVVGHPTDELEEQGQKVKAWMNYYLTHVDKDYYPDSERLLLYLGLVGCAFRKVYQDPISNRPVARFIDPQDFIINNKARSILSSSRLTHREFLTKKEVLLRCATGFYSDLGVPVVSDEIEMSETKRTVSRTEGVNLENTDKETLYKFYEVHADLDIEDMDVDDDNMQSMPRPYIVTICEQNRTIYSIRRNWLPDDATFTRIPSFVQYNYLPGFGLYGIGLSQLLGSNSNALTSILRQLVDSGTLKNFPGGLMIKGMRNEKNDKPVGPSEFLTIETGGLPIQDCVMMMPYQEPSVVLKELRNELVEQTQILAGTAETQVADGKEETPVGTMLAILEVSNKVQSSVLRSLHQSLSVELEYIYRLFGEGMDEENPYDFNAPDGVSGKITKYDFNENIKIIPVSDPNLTTSTQRLLRAEAILRLAQSAPQLHDMRDAYHRMYVSMGVDNLDRLLPPEKDVVPLDPITENMNAMEGKPIKAALWQDHQSHIMVHQVFAQQNPDIQAMPAHIQEHRAFDYYMQMQYMMGQQMPPLEELENPEVQNKIAQEAAKVAMQQRQAMEQQNPPPLDPNAVMMADVQQRDKAAELRKEEAELRTEVDAFKAQLVHETAKKKIEADLFMAEQKSETDLEIAELKSDTDIVNMQQKVKQEKSKHE